MMGPRMVWGAAAMAALLLGAATAHAEDPPALRAEPSPSASDAPAAHGLFDEGRALLAEGQVELACAKFEAAHAMSPLAGVLLNMASCHEKMGKVATAWAEFREALSVARSDGRSDRVAFAEARLAALTPRVPRLEILPPPGLVVQVRRDGVALPTASLGIGLPVDPGLHRLQIEAAGHLPMELEVTLLEGQNLRLQVPPLEPAGAPSAGATLPASFHPTREPRPAPSDPSTARTLGWGLVGVGAAAFVVGAIAGGVAIGEESAAEAAGCDATTCPPAGLSRSNTAATAATLANVLIPGGLVVAGGGAALVVWAAPADPAARRGVSVAARW